MKRITTGLPMIAVAMISFPLMAAEAKKIAAIDFFGYEGLDANAVRRALPFGEGDVMPPAADYPGWKATIRKTVHEMTGRESTDQAFVCCDQHGNWVIYIGLRGTSVTDPRLKAEPRGPVRLAPDVMKLDAELSQAWEASVHTGEHATLSAKLQAMRQLAPKHERSLLDVVANSADRAHRSAAAFAIGHAMDPSDARLAALLAAVSDPNSTVRNNAVRGLDVWVVEHAAWRSKIPPGVFIDLVRSGTWSDRNKASGLLMVLTESRDERMLMEIRSHARSALEEMARWRWNGHNTAARRILGRVAGLDEQRLTKLIEVGDVKTILDALR